MEHIQVKCFNPYIFEITFIILKKSTFKNVHKVRKNNKKYFLMYTLTLSSVNWLNLVHTNIKQVVGRY